MKLNDQKNHINLHRKRNFEENDLNDMRILNAKYQGQSLTPFRCSREGQVLSKERFTVSREVQPQK